MRVRIGRFYIRAIREAPTAFLTTVLDAHKANLETGCGSVICSA